MSRRANNASPALLRAVPRGGETPRPCRCGPQGPQQSYAPGPAQPGRAPERDLHHVHGRGEQQVIEHLRSAGQPVHPGAHYHAQDRTQAAQAPQHHHHHGDGMGEIEHGGHRQGEGPHPEGQGTQQAEEEGLDLNPVSHRSREQYPAEHGIDQQGQESQQKTNPCGGDQLAQIDAPTGQAERDFILQGIILILIGKDLVRHDHRQIEAHREKGGQQGQAISEAALKHVAEAEPPQEGQPGGQGQQDQQECPEIRAGHRPAPFRGQVVLHALPLPTGSLSGGRPAGPLPWPPPATPARRPSTGPRSSTERPCFSNSPA